MCRGAARPGGLGRSRAARTARGPARGRACRAAVVQRPRVVGLPARPAGGGRQRAAGAPPPGGSGLTTPVPRSPRIVAAEGPAAWVAASAAPSPRKIPAIHQRRPPTALPPCRGGPGRGGTRSQAGRHCPAMTPSARTVASARAGRPQEGAADMEALKHIAPAWRGRDAYWATKPDADAARDTVAPTRSSGLPQRPAGARRRTHPATRGPRPAAASPPPRRRRGRRG